jgi:molecular chaperone GrpE
MKKKTDEQSEIHKKEAEEWKNKYLRALADYQNLERRTREEKEEVRRFASEIILGRILPVVDTFTKVKKHVKDVGFDLAYKELHAVLHEQGVEHIQVVGLLFNPHEMECIDVVEGKDNIVIEETLPGYRMHGKILRVAQVKVGKSMTNDK